VFAPASAVHKLPRIEEIHGPVKKINPPHKRICQGGVSVSGRSREYLISGLISRGEIVEQQPAEVSPVKEDSGAARARHLPPSLREGARALQGGR